MDKSYIYKHLDENGFSITHPMGIALGYDFDNSQLIAGPESGLQITSETFGYSTEEFEKIILEYIFDTTNVEVNSLNDLGKYSSLNKLPFIIQVYNGTNNNHFYSLAFGKIKGSLYITEDQTFESLGNITEITGNITFRGSRIRSLGHLKKVGGSIFVRQFDPPYTALQSLDNLELVGENLILQNTPINDLGNLKHVGGTLNLKKTNIKSLGQVEFIGGNLFLPKELKGQSLLQNVTIQGDVKYFAS